MTPISKSWASTHILNEFEGKLLNRLQRRRFSYACFPQHRLKKNTSETTAIKWPRAKEKLHNQRANHRCQLSLHAKYLTSAEAKGLVRIYDRVYKI